MEGAALLTLVVLAATTVLLVTEALPIGIVALLGPVVLVLGGVLDAQELWQGLAHPAVVAIAAMFVVSAGISRTNALGFLGDGLTRISERGPRYVLVVMMAAVALISAFTNNTTVVLVGLPVLLAMCEKTDQPPSRYLIPLSFASIFGGMMTLVGTSTNVVVAELSPPDVVLGMWTFLPMGAVYVLAGVLYMAFVGVRFLPDRMALSMTLSRGIPTEYVTEAEIGAGSVLIGKTLDEVSQRNEVQVLELVRNGIIEVPRPDAVLRDGDVLILKGAPGQIVDLSRSGANIVPTEDDRHVTTRDVDMTLAEVIVPPGSRWIDRRVSDIGFRSRYGVSVMALQRHGHHLRQKVGDVYVEPADMLLVQGTVDALRNLRASENLILVEGIEENVPRRAKAPLALSVLLAFVLLVSFTDLGLATCAITCGIAMVLSRCLTAQQAYSSLDFNVLLPLVGFLALSTALEKTGLAQDAASTTMSLLDGAPMWLIVAVLYAITAFASDILSNGAVAALMVKIVVPAAALLGVDPTIFLMTVAFAASAAFLTPVGYQTNLLVYGPGGYRFGDFIRVGLPLRLIFIVLAAVFVPLFYGGPTG